MIDTKISDDEPNDGINRTERKETTHALNRYTVWLRRTYDGSVEVDAASAKEAISKAIQWHCESNDMWKFSGYYNWDGDYVAEEYELLSKVDTIGDEPRCVEVLEEGTWKLCSEDY